ncbi:MAG TPA: pilus assembly protein [Rhodanobacteraceae bacterium]|nr:pilus assembly protein [Rhodanobacteraceae bacterium]
MSPCRLNPASQTRQRGAVLLVALIFLILLTLLALTSSGSSLLQEKMVGATRNAQLAQFGAESALRAAEWRLWQASSNKDVFIRNCASSEQQGCRAYNRKDESGDFYAFRNDPSLSINGGCPSYAFTYGVDNSGNAVNDLTDAGLGNAKLAANPCYIIEYMGIARPPGGGGPQHESGATGAGNIAIGSQDVRLFRITARSIGGNDKVSRIVESTFGALGHE